MMGRQTICGLLLATTVCVVVNIPAPCRACTVFDMSSSGFASSVWHMIPALALFAENGTFFVRLASHIANICLVTLTAGILYQQLG